MKKLRKIFTVSVMLTTVFSMSMIAAPQADAASAGDLVKLEGNSAVYYLGEDGKRHVFPNEATYFSWYSDFSEITIISQSELEEFGRGANATVRPGTRLVTSPDESTVYAVEEGGTLRSIVSEANAIALYGSDWAKNVVDVPASFMSNYVTGSALTPGVYPQGTLVKSTTSADVYYIDADGKARKFADSAAFLANNFKWDDIVESTLSLPTEGTTISGKETDITDVAQGGSGTGPIIDPNAGSGLTVSLSSATAASANVPTGAALVPFVDVNLTAANDGDVLVKNIVFTRTGIGKSSDFNGAYVYDGATRLTNSRTVSTSNNTVTFNGVNVNVKAGTTKTVTLRANIAAANSGGNNAFKINAASDITTNGATVSGSFPVAGNSMSLSSVTAGTLTYSLQSVANTALKVGDTQEEVAKIKITAGSGEDISVLSLAFTNDGSADPEDLKNFKLYQSSTLVASVDSVTGDRVTMVFNTPFEISKGSNKNFSLLADIAGGVGTGAIQYNIDDLTDVVAEGKDYGFNVGVISGGTVSSITIEAGELTIEVDGPASYEVSTDVDDAVIADLTINTGSDEDVEVKNFYAYIDGTEADADDNLESAIENVQLVNVDTGDVYDVTADDAVATDDDYFFQVTNFTIPGGESHWRIEADLINSGTNMVENGDVFKFVMFAGADVAGYAGQASSGKKGIKAENNSGKALDEIKPGAIVEGNNVTVETASLSVANVALSSGNSVLKTKDVILSKLSLKAGASEDIKITELVFENSGVGGNLANGSNYTLYNSDDEVLKDGISSVGGATVTFSSLNGGGYTIKAGQTETVYVTADVNSATTTGTTLKMQLKADSITAEDSDGDTLASTAITGDSAPIVGRLVTIHESGSIAFSVDSDSPDKATILLSSSVDNSVLKIKADATYEDVVIKTLKFKNSADNGTTNTSDDAIASVSLYQDGEFVDTVETITNTHYVEFTELDSKDVIVKADTDSIFEVKINIGGIGDGAGDTASSSEKITLTLTSGGTDIEARGYSSNNDLATGAITATSVTTKDQYVYASKVIATKVDNQPTSLSAGEEEALKFKLVPSTLENETAKFKDITINFVESGSVDVYGFKLYNGAGTMIASSTAGSVAAGTSGSVNMPAFSDDISGNGETYTIKVFSDSANEDDKLTVSLDINGAAGSGDDITWSDGSTGAGNVTWINLGETETTTKIENQLLY